MKENYKNGVQNGFLVGKYFYLHVPGYAVESIFGTPDAVLAMYRLDKNEIACYSLLLKGHEILGDSDYFDGLSDGLNIFLCLFELDSNTLMERFGMDNPDQIIKAVKPGTIIKQLIKLIVYGSISNKDKESLTAQGGI